MSWQEKVRLDENFNLVVDFPKGFVFGANRPSEPSKKAKKKQPRQDEYLIKSKPKPKPKQKAKLKTQPATTTQPSPAPQPQDPYILDLSDSDTLWPALQRRVIPTPPQTFSFANYKPPQRPGWYTLLLPKFSYLSLIGSSHVPHSTYLNIRLHELQKIRNMNLFSTGAAKSNTYGLWLLAQTLKVLIPMLRVRRLIRRFIQLWHIYRCNKRAETLDPFTLCEATNPISIYCMKVHKRYDFDAHSIIKHISSCLSYQNSAFPVAAPPKLPQTNEPLSYYQLISIFDQARQKGIWSSVLSNFRVTNFDLARFSCLYSQDLQQRAIRAENLCNDSFVVRDNIVYYFGKACDNQRIYPTLLDYKLMDYVVANHITHPYVQAWKNTVTAYLTEFNIYHLSAERKTQIVANFNRKGAILLRLFCQFKKQMFPKFLAAQQQLEEEQEDENEEIFGDNEAEAEDQDE